jgi:hypothetical protein
MAVITTEFRQASHATSVSSSVRIPAADNSTAHELAFTEPAQPAFNPGMAAIDVTTQTSFQYVHYSVSGGDTLIREQSSLDASGNPLSTVRGTVASLPGGAIQLTVTRLYANSITLAVSASRGSSAYTLSCREVTALAP